MKTIRGLPVGDLKIVAISYYGLTWDFKADEPVTIVLDGPTMFAAKWEPFGHVCSCCGSTRLKYTCLVVHTPTMTGYYIGRDCAAHIDELQYERWKNVTLTMSHLARARFRVAKWIHHNPEHETVVRWARSQPEQSPAKDVYARLSKHGDLTTRQISLLYKLRMEDTMRQTNERYQRLYREARSKS